MEVWTDTYLHERESVCVYVDSLIRIIDIQERIHVLQDTTWNLQGGDANENRGKKRRLEKEASSDIRVKLCLTLLVFPHMLEFITNESNR